MQTTLQGSAGPARHETGARNLPDDFDSLAPVLAGARARGVADAFECLGMPAILIDESGSVLHVAPSAAKLFGDDLAVSHRQLVGQTQDTNQAIQDLIAGALSRQAPGASPPVRVARRDSAPLELSSVAVPYSDPMQLLRAVIVVTEKSEASSEAARGLSLAA